MSLEVTKKIVAQMRAQGNQPGVIRIFKAELAKFAASHPGMKDAQAISAWLPHVAERPFYTARELVPLFPALALALGFETRLTPQKSSLRLAKELEFCNLPKLQHVNGRTIFKHPSYQNERFYTEFFIVEQVHKWRKVKMRQAELEAEFGK